MKTSLDNTVVHDADGNLTNDAVWVRTWNAENRVTRIESAATVPLAAKKREDWKFLPDGRWIERIVSTNNGAAYENGEGSVLEK